jgi:hypothetical protein
MESQVVGLYIHGLRSSDPDDTEPTPMLAMPSVEAIEGQGIRQDRRYFRPADPGRDRLRQVSLIDEGTIWRHERIFGAIDRSFLKAQIILKGDVHLPNLVGWTLDFEDGAQLTISIMRKPCFAMDLIYPGLRDAMQRGEQGALARVARSGKIATGQAVQIFLADSEVERATG